jgi:hypothetical protein
VIRAGQKVFGVLILVALAAAGEATIPLYGAAAGVGAAGSAGSEPSIVDALAPDFDGDGYADLVVGALNEDVDAAVDAGGVNVIYGSAGGLTTAGDQFFSQATTNVEGVPESGDWFGLSVAAGDFDGDGFADLAVGVPGEDAGKGAVEVLYGSASGLSASGDQLWTQDSAGILGVGEDGDLFGFALTAGRFDADPYADLAIGIPSEDLDSTGEGAVTVLSGSSGGLASTGNQLFTQDSSGIEDQAEAGDGFGWALASADFGRGSRADLAIGVPFEGLHQGSEGAVNVLYGSTSGLGSNGDQLWSQDELGLAEDSDSGDYFGWSLAAADFGLGTRADLAVGVPYEDVNATDQGAVNIVYGTPDGLSSAGAQLWHQDSFDIDDQGSSFDDFGFSLAAGNFGRGARADLAVGVPYEDLPGLPDAGLIHVLYGTPGGISYQDGELWTQNDPDVENSAEAGDVFGLALSAANFGNSAEADLVIGVPFEDLGIVNAGAVHVLSGSPDGVTAVGERFYSQNYVGIEDQTEPEDRWASGLVT